MKSLELSNKDIRDILSPFDLRKFRSITDVGLTEKVNINVNRSLGRSLKQIK